LREVNGAIPAATTIMVKTTNKLAPVRASAGQIARRPTVVDDIEAQEDDEAPIEVVERDLRVNHSIGILSSTP